MDYECKICKIKYTSRSGIWKHNTKYHNSNVIKMSSFCHDNVNKMSSFCHDNLKCRKCNKK